jgi:hypothetical protein
VDVTEPANRHNSLTASLQQRGQQELAPPLQQDKELRRAASLVSVSSWSGAATIAPHYSIVVCLRCALLLPASAGVILQAAASCMHTHLRVLAMPACCNAVGQPWLGQSTALPRVSAIRTSRVTSETAEVRETPRLVVDKLKVGKCLQGRQQQ